MLIHTRVHAVPALGGEQRGSVASLLAVSFPEAAFDKFIRLSPPFYYIFLNVDDSFHETP